MWQAASIKSSGYLLSRDKWEWMEEKLLLYVILQTLDTCPRHPLKGQDRGHIDGNRFVPKASEYNSSINNISFFLCWFCCLMACYFHSVLPYIKKKIVSVKDRVRQTETGHSMLWITGAIYTFLSLALCFHKNCVHYVCQLLGYGCDCQQVQSC